LILLETADALGAAKVEDVLAVKSGGQNVSVDFLERAAVLLQAAIRKTTADDLICMHFIDVAFRLLPCPVELHVS
jgi:hypothetical protein